MTHLTVNAQVKGILDDGGIAGPLPRWQRKAREQGITMLPTSNENSAVAGTVKRGKSPGRTMLSVRSKTPTRLPPNTSNLLAETSYPGDRFIPVRPTEIEMDRSHHAIMKQIRKEEGVEAPEEELTQQQREHREKLVENLNDGQSVDERVLRYSRQPPQVAGAVGNHKVLYSASKSASKGMTTRHIPNVPERVLDAPELMDDYYLHLIAWSSKNHMAVALAGNIYVWNASDGKIFMMNAVEPPDYICSVAWIKDGTVVAVGLSDGQVQLWDVTEVRQLRSMTGHGGRVATLSWSLNNALASGSRVGQIIHHDVRLPNHVAAVVSAHNQEVCGLGWSADARHLASGGNDNMVCVWDLRNSIPLFKHSDHQAAVKAVAWCPWQNNILATGGGTADRTIRVWNTNSGLCVKEVLTNSQVSSCVWSAEYKELVSGHGFNDHQVTVWKYPTFSKVIDLTGHTNRVLELATSPDGQMVASAAADETIRLWKVWPTLGKEKKIQRALQPTSVLSMGSIR